MNLMKAKIGIVGMGFYFPGTIIDTKELADEMNLDEKVYENIGVKKIFKPSKADRPTQMAYKSSLKALKDAKISAEDIDLIIIAAFKNDYMNWQMSGWLKDRLGANNAMTLEIKGGCATYFQAVEMAIDQIKASLDINTVLITCSEKFYGYGWPTFLSSGSQSIIIKRNCEEFVYLGLETSNYIINHDIAYIPTGGTLFPFTSETEWKGEGFVDNVVVDSEKYRKYIKPIVFDKFVEVTENLLNQTGYKKQDIDYMVTLVQQRNFDERILKSLDMTHISSAQEFKEELGHFSGADPYILLDKARKNGRIKKGDLILNIGIGGVAWFASLIRY